MTKGLGIYCPWITENALSPTPALRVGLVADQSDPQCCKKVQKHPVERCSECKLQHEWSDSESTFVAVSNRFDPEQLGFAIQNSVVFNQFQGIDFTLGEGFGSPFSHTHKETCSKTMTITPAVRRVIYTD